MGKAVQRPKKHIISCRVDDWELRTLRRLAKSSNTNISNLLRRSLDMLEEASAGERRARA
jgi:hypothetical protein